MVLSCCFTQRHYARTIGLVLSSRNGARYFGVSGRKQEVAIAYRIKSGDHDVIDALRRIAGEQIDRAIASTDGDGEPGRRVHDIRKRLKKLRGLIRLVRPVFPDHDAENIAFRDAARRVSGLRDAQVLGKTYDALMERHEAHLERSAFAPFRRQITQSARSRDVAGDLAAVRQDLAAARDRVPLWTLRETGFDAVADGLARTYRRARKGREAESDADLHRWRKRVKYHGYHVRLLRDLWPEHMEGRRSTVDKLGDLLGHHQDLVVFGDHIADAPLDDPAKRVLRGIVDRRKAATAEAARQLAPLLFADKPKALVGRWGVWWEVWRG